MMMAMCLLLGSLPVQADIIEQILVKVNGEIFTKTDLEERQVAYLRQNEPGFDPGALSDAEFTQKLAEITPPLMVGVIDELLLMQHGRDLGYQLGDEQFETVIANIKSENNIETDAEFDAALDQEGMTLAELRRALERQMLVSRVQQVEVFGSVSVTEPEQREYYEAHLDSFVVPPSITIREILIGAPSLDGAESAFEAGLAQAAAEAARQKAEATLARVLAGEAFDVVVGEVSEAPSRANGGLIGPVDPEELAPALKSVVEQLEVGDVSEIVRTPRGFQFFRLESAIPAGHRPFEEIQEEVADEIGAEKGRVGYVRLIERLRGEALIDWKNEDLQRAYEQQLQRQREEESGAADSSSPVA